MQCQRQERRAETSVARSLGFPHPHLNPSGLKACREPHYPNLHRCCAGGVHWPSAPAWERTGQAGRMERPRCFRGSAGVRRQGAGIAPGSWVPSPSSLPFSFHFFRELLLFTRGAELRGLRTWRCLRGRTERAKNVVLSPVASQGLAGAQGVGRRPAARQPLARTPSLGLWTSLRLTKG